MPPTFGEAAREFILACQADGLSLKTSDWYAYVLKPLVAQHAATPIDQVAVNAIRQYLADLRTAPSHRRGSLTAQGPLSPETIRGRIRALHRFFTWCQAEYNLDPAHNPMSRIRMPPASRQEPKGIAMDDLRKLLEACDESPAGRRDLAMLCFLADTGCRASGMLTLTLDRLDEGRGRAILREKGERTHGVSFNAYTAQALRGWLLVRPFEATTVFCALHPNVWAEPLTVSGLHQVLRRLKVRAGVTGRCNPHSFRHGFARAFLEAGGNVATLSRLMGHSDPRVTMNFYAVFSDAELREQHARFSPMRDFMKGGDP